MAMLVTGDLIYAVPANNMTDLETRREVEYQVHRGVFYDYETAVEAQVGENLSEIRILGSFGRSDWNRESDLDAWIVLNSPPNIRALGVMSETEWDYRKQLGAQYDFPYLGRHRATFFTRSEADLYDLTFPVRCGVPHALGETTVLFGPDPQPMSTDVADLVVSLQEFKDLYAKAVQGNGCLPHKYIRRMFREMVYYREGQRLSSNWVVDMEMSRRELKDPDVLREVDRFIARANLPYPSLAFRDLAHKLFFTLEKMRWELMYAVTDPREFDLWRTNQVRHHAFFPDQIYTLLDNAGQALNLDPEPVLSAFTAAISLPFDPELVQQFHSLHSSWTVKATELALIKSHAS